MKTLGQTLNVAVVGSGISGLAAAYRLHQAGAQVTLFESGDYFGGHSHTVDVTLDGITSPVDTGFLVFNHRTYPNLTRLFEQLRVETAASDMSFSVQHAESGRVLEWAGNNLDSVFAQRRNLLRPRFIGMLSDMLRFNRAATEIAQYGEQAAWHQSLGDYLLTQGYGAAFRDWYLLPMAGCIWSCPPRQMLQFPLATFVRFCHNHGLLQINDRPQWYTVRGGARSYVEKLLAPLPDKRLATPVWRIDRRLRAGRQQVCVTSAAGEAWFDHVVLACHSNQALALLQDATSAERTLLGAIRYQQNRAVLHSDARCLPQARRAWAAWNYQSLGGDVPAVCVHYLINKLQPLPFRQPVIVSLNPLEEPDPQQVVAEFDYAHPVFDAAAVAAQSELDRIQGASHAWFAGAWTGYGFHEDGLKSGLAAAQAILTRAN